MTAKQGTIAVETQNIFPIIKKYLYSDHDVFMRELISNACDATNKLKTLSQHGEIEGDMEDLSINVEINKDNKTITISDQGIGMTIEEVEKYINQIAFSGAYEFMEKYKDANIIGHFGLGFYSAFMIADKVEILTKSYKKGTKAAHWVCEGNPEFTIQEHNRRKRGTSIILHISKENEEYLETSRIKTLLEKYCKFNSVPILFEKERINDTNPIWTKKPMDLKDEDYAAFYKKLQPFSEEPLFHIHLNVDYPFNLMGVLYFPKLNKNNFEVNKNKIQLYCNQVYVTDEVKDIVPEFLQLLHGVIDSPDIPLNVSRSYLQSDENVKKITSHITKKVADKLEELFKQDRAMYAAKWESLGVFVKYGMLTDEKFYDRAKTFCIFETIEGEYLTIAEYKEKVKNIQVDKNDKTVFLYTHDIVAQDAQLQACKERGMLVIKLDHIIDTHLVSQLEYKVEKATFKRIDAESIDKLVDKGEQKESVLSTEQKERLKTICEKAAKAVPSAMVQLQNLDPNDNPLEIVKPEFIRRMEEMQKIQGGASWMGELGGNTYNLIVNTNNKAIIDLLELPESEQLQAFQHYHKIARLSKNMLQGAELTTLIRELYTKSYKKVTQTD